MAIEIRYNKGRTFENEAFRRIAKMLSKYFEDKKLDGLLIGNAFVETNEHLRPDILLYSSFGTLIIDLKDGSGELKLPLQKEFETKPWSINGRVVKAGSDRNINPYVQLKRISNRYLKTLKELKFTNPAIISQVLPETRETPDFLYYSTMVLFSGEVKTDSASIPYPINRWFFVADESNLLNKIEDISNNGKYSAGFGNLIKSVFKANPYTIENNPIIDEYKPRLDIEYTQTQKECLDKIKTFVNQNEKKVFILRGKEKAGKSFLIPEISKLALENNCTQIETLTVTKRIASKLNKLNPELFFSSIYSVIYGGSPVSEIEEEEDEIINESEDVVSVEESSENEADLLEADVIPLRKSMSDIEDSSLFIVDEAQLLNSSLFQSENIKFGSGKLLDDFLKFVQIGSTNRKIIFIGDPFQLSYGSYETSAIFPNHIFNLVGVEPMIATLVSEKESESLIEKNIDAVSRQISKQQFNSLTLFKGESVQEILSEPDRLDILKKYYFENKEIKVLCYKNETAFNINRDIREKIFGRKTSLSLGDLLVLDNNIRIISHDPHETPLFFNNGTTLEVVDLKDEQPQDPILLPDKKTKIILITREVKVKEQGKEKVSSILILENYRLNPKGKLSNEEFVALKILQHRRIESRSGVIGFENSNYYKNLINDEKYKSLLSEQETLSVQVNQGEKKKILLKQVRSKLKRIKKTYEKAFKYEIRRELMVNDTFFNLANVRFSYAQIVHKSLGEYYSNVIFDVNMEKGKSNREYFQWLYTGLTRARDKLFIINFEEIQPLQDAKYGEIIATTISKDEPKKEESIPYEVKPASPEFKKSLGNWGLPELVINNAFTIIDWLRNHNITAMVEYNVKSKYLVKIKNEEITVIFNFNGNGIPGIPRIEKGSNELKLKFLSWLSPKEDQNVLFPVGWRNEIYQRWNNAFIEIGYNWKHFESHGYKDRIWLHKNDTFMVLDIDFNDGAFITGIKPLKTNNAESWPVLKQTISSINYFA